MNNPKVFQVQFNMNFGETNCVFFALIKPTDNPQKFHVLRVHSLYPKENAAVIDDFNITKTIRSGITTWVHADSEISSAIVQAIGDALENHYHLPVLS